MWIEQSRVTFNQIKQVISSNFQARSNDPFRGSAACIIEQHYMLKADACYSWGSITRRGLLAGLVSLERLAFRDLFIRVYSEC